MLKKLFRYDFKEIGKNLWLFTAVVVALAVLGCVSSEILWNINWQDHDIPTMLKVAVILSLGMIILVGFVAVIAYTVLSVIFITRRYYTNLFTDEGYLTFTLPAKISTIFNAKVLAGVLWSVIVSVVVILCFAALYIFSSSPDGISGISQSIKDSLSFYLPDFEMSTLSIVVTGVIYLFAGISALMYELLLIYLCITLGSVIAKKGKLPLGIGLYFGANAVCSTVVSVLTFVASIFTSEMYDKVQMDDYSGLAKIYFLEMNMQMIITLVVYTCVAVGAYFLNRYFLKNKLNLP